MRSIEMIALVLFAVIISGIFLSFMFNTDYQGIFDYTMNFFNKTPSEETIPLVNLKELAQKMDSCWNDCEMGSIKLDCGVVNLSSTDFNSTEINQGITKEKISFFTQKYNYCMDCNFSINSTSGKIMPNNIIKISCNNITNNIVLIQ